MEEINFEKALADLEKIVEKLEAGNIPLAKSIELFEKGLKISRYLRDELEKAERKVEILLKDEKGEFKKQDFKLKEEDLEEEEGEEEEEEEEEIIDEEELNSEEENEGR
ncbi:MAG: exodeoxyribonuclease VII small subunit [Acidobacteriota bacterium]